MARNLALDLDRERGTPNAPPPVMASVAIPKPVDVTVPSIPDEPIAKPTNTQVAMIMPGNKREAAVMAKLESRKRP